MPGQPVQHDRRVRGSGVLGTGQPAQPGVLEVPPQRAVEPVGAAPPACARVVGPLPQFVDQSPQFVAHRTPSARATIPRRISLVPPRSVKAGAAATAWPADLAAGRRSWTAGPARARPAALDHLLLEPGAEILDQRGARRDVVAALQRARHRDRQLPQRPDRAVRSPDSAAAPRRRRAPSEPSQASSSGSGLMNRSGPLRS